MPIIEYCLPKSIKPKFNIVYRKTSDFKLLNMICFLFQEVGEIYDTLKFPIEFLVDRKMPFFPRFSSQFFEYFLIVFIMAVYNNFYWFYVSPRYVISLFFSENSINWLETSWYRGLKDWQLSHIWYSLPFNIYIVNVF